jgi:hypothetical protein
MKIGPLFPETALILGLLQFWNKDCMEMLQGLSPRILAGGHSEHKIYYNA